MAKIHLQLVTPQRQVLSEELESLSCPTTMGQITILPNHIPLVTELAVGELTARTGGGQEHNIHVAGGFLEVKPDNTVVILADAAEHHYEIDETEMEAAKIRAEETMRQSNVSDVEFALAAASLERTVSKLNLVRKYRSRRSSEQISNLQKDIDQQ